jgi:hypothetical protein
MSDCRQLSLQRVQSQGAYLLLRAVHRGADPALPLPIWGAWSMPLQWAWISLVAMLFAARHWIDRGFGAAMMALGVRVPATARD